MICKSLPLNILIGQASGRYSRKIGNWRRVLKDLLNELSLKNLSFNHNNVFYYIRVLYVKPIYQNSETKLLHVVKDDQNSDSLCRNHL